MRCLAGQYATFVLVECFFVGEFVECFLHGFGVEVEVHEPGFDVDRQGRTVVDGPLHRIPVQRTIGVVRVAEHRPRVVVLRRDRRAGQADEPRVGQRLAHVETEAALLGAMGFVDHHHDVGTVVELSGLVEPVDGGDDHPTGIVT